MEHGNGRPCNRFRANRRLADFELLRPCRSCGFQLGYLRNADCRKTAGLPLPAARGTTNLIYLREEFVFYGGALGDSVGEDVVLSAVHAAESQGVDLGLFRVHKDGLMRSGTLRLNQTIRSGADFARGEGDNLGWSHARSRSKNCILSYRLNISDV